MTNTKNQLLKKIERMSDYQLRIVLGFVNRLFRP